jgi:hypothetical protein
MRKLDQALEQIHDLEPERRSEVGTVQRRCTMAAENDGKPQPTRLSGAPKMTRRHLTSRTWLPEQIQELRALVKAGASPVRAAARFKRTVIAVQTVAKLNGFPFPDFRKVKRRQRIRESEVRRDLGLE